MAEIVSLAEAVERAIRRRRHRRDGGLHPPDPVRRRARDDPAAAPRPDPGPDDPRRHLRPAHRRGLRAQARLLLGRQPGRRLAAPVPRRGRARAGRSRSRSRSTATPGWPTATWPARRGLPFAVLRGYAGTGPARPAHADDRADHLPVHRRGADRRAGAAARRRRSSTPSAPTGRGNVQLWGITGVQKEAVLAARRSRGHRRGDRRRARRRVPGAVVLPSLDGRRACAPCPAARIRPTRSGTTSGTTTSTVAWDAISRDRDTRSRRWLDEHVCRAQAVTGRDAALHPDEMMSGDRGPRALRDGMVCFVGIGLPSAAANLARGHARAVLVLIYESGTLGAKPDRLPLSIGDGDAGRDGRRRGHRVPEIFNYWLQPGRIDVGFLGARPDRPVRQHQHHRRRRRLRPAQACGCPARAARRRSPRRAAR